MSYKFKVGDKGKTIGGKDYEVLVVGLEDKLAHGLSMVVLIDGNALSRDSNGRLDSDNAIFQGNLLPPPKTMYRGTCQQLLNDGKVTATYIYEADEEALVTKWLRHMPDYKIEEFEVPQT